MAIQNNQLDTVLFAAVETTGAANVTGDGTIYTVVYDDVTDDTGSNFNGGTGIFTAPVLGVYSFQTSILCSALISTNTIFTVRIATSNLGAVYIMDFDSIAYPAGSAAACGAIMLRMPAAATAKVELKISGHSSANVSLEPNSMFSGKLELDLTT